ncbi:hypothetical protein IFM89_015606 [Coptis chinensis]|uniref:Uncharacterized protein n=1 Tax=Coptis chinensis TaxID=261450 RepID=A0A835I2K4_9MAGN|nr:hypothetical protein IFM89_015606 [Coptis chinensis]
MEEYEEPAQGGGIQSLALAALKNCFLVGGSVVKVVKNFSNGINGRVFISSNYEVRSHLTRLHQLDIEMGRMVSEWNFEKKWHDISNSKGSQLDPSTSTFLGLDDNRLCRWDNNTFFWLFVVGQTLSLGISAGNAKRLLKADEDRAFNASDLERFKIAPLLLEFVVFLF